LSPRPPYPLSTLSLHDALPISPIVLTTLNTTPILNGASGGTLINVSAAGTLSVGTTYAVMNYAGTLDNASFGTFALGTLPNRVRSEEHTSELQSPDHLVCRLLL